MSHYYFRDGIPCFTVPNKSNPGEDRPTTLADAKKLELLPSVTTILAYRSRPDLDNWKQNQTIDAALSTPRLLEETEEEHKKRIKIKAAEISDKAATTGSLIHAYIEQLIQNHANLSINDDLRHISDPVKDWVESKNFQGVSEKIFVADRYAGTIDFMGSYSDQPNVIIDFKTKATRAKEKITPYYEWKLQLAAYQRMSGNYNSVLQNVVISTMEANRIEVFTYDQEEIDDCYNVFNHILEAYWGEKYGRISRINKES